MKHRLLTINASARSNRSITRRLVDQLAQTWLSSRPGGDVIHRDVGLNPPSAINQDWIASAYSPAAGRSSEMSAALAESEALIAEIEAAEAIIIGTPLYNFGMPAVLKLWIEQIVRVNRTFEIVSGETGETYRPLLRSKPVVVIVAAGNRAFLHGGPLAALNFLESHLGSVLTFLGFTEITFVRISETEAKSGAHSPELSAATDRLRAR